MSYRIRGIVSILSVAALGAPDPALAQIPGDRWTEAAAEFVHLLRDGRFAEAAARVSAAIPAGALGPEQLETIWTQLTATSGPLLGLSPQRAVEQGALHVVDMAASFERQPLTIRVVFNADLELSGLWFLPPSPPTYEPPGYVDESAFREKDVTVGVEPWLLPATLSIPRAPGPHPAIVLVHGSGPHDRDETIGPNRPFRDLAWGLASNGIAVLRYEKRTRQWASRIQSTGFTVEQEVIEDALAALRAVRADTAVDAGRVFVAGHSLGGMLAPTIAVRDGAIAGAILLAAPARPIDQVLIDQLEYIAGLPQSDEAARASIAASLDTIARLEAAELPPDQHVMGAPASYYYDLRTMDPIAAARQLDAPILVVHGGRDYQVTEDDLALWSEALPPTATIRQFPDLNHLFIEGAGRATPTEYFSTAGHVDRAVIEQIVQWVRDRQ